METTVIVILSFLCVILLYLVFTRKKEGDAAPKTRKKPKMCPLCGSLLVHDEDCVIGEFANIDGKKKVYIYGCNYCLRGKRHGKRISL